MLAEFDTDFPMKTDDIKKDDEVRQALLFLETSFYIVHRTLVWCIFFTYFIVFNHDGER